MTKLTGVGHSLKEAQVLQQKVADAIKILQVTSTHTHTHTADDVIIASTKEFDLLL